jgi:ribosomal protein S4E
VSCFYREAAGVDDLKQGSREQQIKNFCAQLRATSKAILHGAEKKERSFAVGFGDVLRVTRLRMTWRLFLDGLHERRWNV